MSDLNKTTGQRRAAQAKTNYRAAEINRLLNEGVSLSKSAKMLGINYQHAKVLITLVK